jgi:TolB-like protein/thioredoxin-like negative regulator of GroEL
VSLYSELKRRNVIRVAIVYLAGSWLLIQILETLFPIYGLDETSIQIVVTILAIGFIPALILAWVFELTPEGLKKDAAVDQDIPASRTFDRVVVIVLVLALAFFAYDKFVLDPARDAEVIETAAERARTEALYESFGDKSIVVLPFANMSTDPEQEFFSDGITEELLNLLAKIRELRVISRTSAFYFKGKDVDLGTIAERLKVDHVLEGSVRQAGNRVRITAQLIDARTDTHLWSETYDRELNDVFAIQDEISTHVVNQLKVTILGDLPHAEQIDTVAYSKFLRARYIAHSGQVGKQELAEQLLNEVLEIEPDYIPALEALGTVYFGYSEEEQLVRDVSMRISAIEPDGAASLRVQAGLADYYDHDPAKAAPLYERALALDPGDLKTLLYVSGFLRRIGRIEDAITTYEYIILRDPACIYCLMGLSLTYRTAGRYDRAIEILRDAVAWSPDRMGIYWALGSVLLQAGRPEEALAAFEKQRDDDTLSFARIFVLHDLGRMQEFEDEFAELRSDSDQSPEGIARIYAWTGNNDLALEWLEKMVEVEGQDRLKNITNGGFYTKLKRDPRFDALLRKYGQHPDQQEVIAFKFTPPGSKTP